MYYLVDMDFVLHLIHVEALDNGYKHIIIVLHVDKLLINKIDFEQDDPVIVTKCNHCFCNSISSKCG